MIHQVTERNTQGQPCQIEGVYLGGHICGLTSFDSIFAAANRAGGGGSHSTEEMMSLIFFFQISRRDA